MRCRYGKTEKGGVTAEFAILMPAFVGLLVLVIGVAAQQERVISVQEKLASLARLVEAGKTLSEVDSAGVGLGLRIKVNEIDGLVCLTAEAPMKVLGVAGYQQSLRACGLAPGS